jgi:hypothetical protein
MILALETLVFRATAGLTIQGPGARLRSDFYVLATER